MEYSITCNGFDPNLIFGNLKGEIIDYKLSSYLVNLKLIYLYYNHPAIEIHCNKAYGKLGNEPFIHLHELEPPGIYHSKFVLITTTEMLRLIVMTTNITEQLVQNCMNDYYIIDIPKSIRMYNTENVQTLNKYLDAFGIKMKVPIIMYDWSLVTGRLLVSIPKKDSHGIGFQRIKQLQYDKFTRQLGKPVKRILGKCTIMTSSAMLGYDIRTILGVQDVKFQYVKNIDGMNWILYDLEHNKDEKGKERYQLEEVRSFPFHFKRYTIEYSYQGLKSKWLIITSANLTRQAWGTTRYAAINAEMGIAWNTKQDFPFLEVPMILEKKNN